MSMRVHDLAAEFGVASDELMKLLREMDIFVRSHLSALEEDKVSRVRARWEREKRKEKAPALSKGRRRAAPKAKAKPVVEEAPPPMEARPKRRRRTAAEVAVQEAEAAAVAAAEAATREPEIVPLVFEEVPEEPALHVTELFPPELAPPEAESSETGAPAAETPTFLAPAAPPPSITAVPVASASPQSRPQPFIPTPVQRPMSARPKPVASAVPGAGAPPPRPVASAAPGGIIEDRRRDKKKRKKGKKWTVDQEAVAENVARTLATIRGPAKKGVRRRDDEPSFRELEAQRVAEEKEKEKTLVHVNEFISVAEDLLQGRADQQAEESGRHQEARH